MDRDCDRDLGHPRDRDHDRDCGHHGHVQMRDPY